MQYALQVFEYEDNSAFRTLEIDGQPWFVLADVCRALDLQPKNGSFYHHGERLDPDEKQTIPSAWLQSKATSPSRREGSPSQGAPRVIAISESGLYSLILTSTKPQAKRFKKWVTAEVLPSIRKTGGYGKNVPAFIRRYNQNWDRVDQGYFSVINELAVHIWGRLEHAGHIMAESPKGTENRPDVSVGRLFADWLRENHSDVCADYKMYRHTTPEWEGEARQYPNSLLGLFREFVDTVWMEEHFERYFNTRDPAALPYMQKVLLPRHSST